MDSWQTRAIGTNFHGRIQAGMAAVMAEQDVTCGVLRAVVDASLVHKMAIYSRMDSFNDAQIRC